MTIIYRTRMGTIEERVLVRKTPKGFRVEYQGGMHGTFVVPARSWSPGAYGGVEFHTSIATEDRQVALDHATHQLKSYEDWAYAHIAKAEQLRDELPFYGHGIAGADDET